MIYLISYKGGSYAVMVMGEHSSLGWRVVEYGTGKPLTEYSLDIDDAYRFIKKHRVLREQEDNDFFAMIKDK